MLKLTPEQRETAEAPGKRPYWRFLLSPGSVAWDDLVLGPRQVKLAAVSDPVAVRADGMPTYTFASALDDLESDVTHLIRGEDHVTNAAVQLDSTRHSAAIPRGCGSAIFRSWSAAPAKSSPSGWTAPRCAGCVRMASNPPPSPPTLPGSAPPTIPSRCRSRPWRSTSISGASRTRRRASIPHSFSR